MREKSLLDKLWDKPKFKIESVPEFVARGGKIRRVDFSKAYAKFQYFGSSYIGKKNKKVET